MAFFHPTKPRVNLLSVSVVILHVLLCGLGVDAEIVVKDLDSNETADVFPDMQASFGDDFPKHGLKGRVVLAEPRTACKPIKKAPPKIDDYVWVVLIERGGCPFTEKVLNAQKANFCSAIVFNYQGNQGLTKMGGSNGSDVDIPSTFVGYNTGLELATQYSYPRFKDYVIHIEEEEDIDYRMYLWPFAIVVGVCFLMIMLFLVIKFVRDHTRTRVARLSKKHLKKIPIRKFKKGQYYDTCAICLEEYEDGEKIRVLPCDHAYHAKCIDPWLTRNKKTCPVCKRRVIPGKDPNSEESNSDSEEGGNASQSTPLLMNSTPGNQRSHGSMNRVDGDSGPTPRAQSAPSLYEATVVLEQEGAVGGVGILAMSDGGSSSTTSYGAVRARTELDGAERGEQREGGSGGKRKRKGGKRGGGEGNEEAASLLLGVEENDEELEEEEKRKAERKERRKKKKEKKKKSRREEEEGDGVVRVRHEVREVSRDNARLLEPVIESDIVAINSNDDGNAEGGAGASGGDSGHVNTGYSDNSQEVVVSSTRKGKKREMSEVV